MTFDLQIDQLAVVSGFASGGSNELQTQGLEPQKDARIEQGAWMDEKNAHERPRLRRMVRQRPGWMQVPHRGWVG
jgi:hypothetical protein